MSGLANGILGLWLASTASAGLTLETLDGAGFAPAPSSEATVLMFWRADCAPCLVELLGARSYIEAASPGRLFFVGLQDAAALRSGAAKTGLPMDRVLRADGAPAAILDALGGPPPRLPLSVALDSAGRVCARHSGLLGTDLVRRWEQLCGGTHADD